MMTTDRGPRKALGRGLASLIPSAPSGAGPGIRTLPIEKIRPNKRQPRKQFDKQRLEELAVSIEHQGVLQPIIVRKVGEEYEIVAGERRWRAATQAGLQEIPVILREFSDRDTLQVALIENIQRADLDPLEEAEAYARLMREHSMTQEQVAEAVGKGRVSIANALRMLKLPEPVLEMLADGRLTAGHAKAIMMVQSDADRIKLAHDTVQRAASVREVEQRARAMSRSQKKAPDKATPAELAVEERLMRKLSTKVRLHQRKGKGRIEIHFHSLDQLDEILDRIAP